jgi:hypothetical protein
MDYIMKTTTYSNSRLQKVIGEISGAQLGFDKKHNNETKPLPDTSAFLVDVKRIYPTERMVEFSFKNKEEENNIYKAWVLVDHWYREGLDLYPSMDQIQETATNILINSGLPLPTHVLKKTWPYYPPDGKPADLKTLLPLLTLLVPGLQGLAITPLVNSTLDFLLEAQRLLPDLNILKSLELLGKTVGDGLRSLSTIFNIIINLEDEVRDEIEKLTKLKEGILAFLEFQIQLPQELISLTDPERLEMVIMGCSLHLLNDSELLELGVKIAGKNKIELHFNIESRLEIDDTSYLRVISLLQLGMLTQLEVIQNMSNEKISIFSKSIQNPDTIKEELLKQLTETEIIHLGSLTQLLSEIKVLEDTALTKIGLLAKLEENIIKTILAPGENILAGLTNLTGSETLNTLIGLTQLGMLTQLEEEIITSLGLGLLLDGLEGLSSNGFVKPQEPLQGAVIPLKGDKNNGLLFLGFIKT